MKHRSTWMYFNLVVLMHGSSPSEMLPAVGLKSMPQDPSYRVYALLSIWDNGHKSAELRVINQWACLWRTSCRNCRRTRYITLKDIRWWLILFFIINSSLAIPSHLNSITSLLIKIYQLPHYCLELNFSKLCIKLTDYFWARWLILNKTINDFGLKIMKIICDGRCNFIVAIHISFLYNYFTCMLITIGEYDAITRAVNSAGESLRGPP